MTRFMDRVFWKYLHGSVGMRVVALYLSQINHSMLCRCLAGGTSNYSGIDCVSKLYKKGVYDIDSSDEVLEIWFEEPFLTM